MYSGTPTYGIRTTASSQASVLLGDRFWRIRWAMKTIARQKPSRVVSSVKTQ